MAAGAERDWLGRSDLAVVGKWLISRDGRRPVLKHLTVLLGALCGLSLLIAFLPLVAADKDTKGDEVSAWGTVFALFMLMSMALGWFSLLLAIRLKAQLIRTDQRLAAQHTAFYRARLEDEFGRKELAFYEQKARWEREQEEWKAKTQNELYEQILDQVDRGLLGPRPKRRDNNG